MTDPGSLNVILNVAGLLLGGTALGVVLRYKLGRQKIAAADEADIRDHYAEELAAVRAERLLDRENWMRLEKHLREALSLSDRRHAECEAARQSLRQELDEMHRDRQKDREEIDGMKIQLKRYSADTLLVLEGSGEKPSEVAPHATASAPRVKKITEDNGK